MAPPPPQLMDDLVGEILLRLPADEPEHLFRAALVCKPWLRLLCDPAFLRRYRAFHKAPPLLGLLHRRTVMPGEPSPRLTPTTAAPLSPTPYHRRALDCRHGRVLLHKVGGGWDLLVWDPVTGDQRRMPEPGFPWLVYSAAVFCAVPGCDHLDCHGGPFRVVFAATHQRKEAIMASVYSSVTGAWSAPASLDSGCESYLQRTRDVARVEGEGRRYYYTPCLQPRRGAVIGDEVYFQIRQGYVRYNWDNNSISIIKTPCPDVYGVALMVMEDSSLGFAYIEGSSLRLWPRKVNSEEDAEWAQCRAIDLKATMPIANSDDKAFVAGSAEGVGAIFVSTDAGLFTINLNGGQVKKVDEPGVFCSVLPYMSFYTPDRSRLLSLVRTH